MFTENPAVFLADFGLACTAGGVAFLGILDQPDELMNMAGVNVASTMYTLLMRTSDATAAALATGGSVNVAGTVYVVRDVLLRDDGTFTQLTLSK